MIVKYFKRMVKPGLHNSWDFLHVRVDPESFSPKVYVKNFTAKMPYFCVLRRKVTYFNVSRQKRHILISPLSPKFSNPGLQDSPSCSQHNCAALARATSAAFLPFGKPVTVWKPLFFGWLQLKQAGWELLCSCHLILWRARKREKSKVKDCL